MTLPSAPEMRAAPSVEIRIGDRSFSTEEASSFYNELRGKSQQIRGSSRSAFRLTKDDLKSLSKRLSEVVLPYKKSEENVSIYVDLNNESMEKFTNLDKFLSYDFSISASTVRINLDIAFLMYNLTSSSIAEFRIDLYLTSGVTLCEIESKRGDNLDNLPFQIPTMNYVISFQDYTLARNCAAIIEDWVRTLKDVEVDATQSYLHRSRRWIRFGIHLSCISICAIFLIFLGAALSVFFNFGSVEIITLNVGLLLFGNRVASALADRAQASLRRLAAHSHIELTTGDRRCFEWYTEHRRKSVWALGISIASAIALNVVGGIIANMLPSIK